MTNDLRQAEADLGYAERRLRQERDDFGATGDRLAFFEARATECRAVVAGLRRDAMNDDEVRRCAADPTWRALEAEWERLWQTDDDEGIGLAYDAWADRTEELIGWRPKALVGVREAAGVA